MCSTGMEEQNNFVPFFLRIRPQARIEFRGEHCDSSYACV